MKRLSCLLSISACLLLILAHYSYAAQKKILAIFNLSATNIEAMGCNGEILQALISSIETDKSIDLLPRREIEEVLYISDIVLDNSEKAVIEAGKALGINFVVFGEVTKKGSLIIARLNLMDIEGKTIINNWSVVFPNSNSILKKIPEIAKEIGASLSNRKKASTISVTETESLPSLDLDYLNVLNEGDSVGLSWKITTQKSPISCNIYRSENRKGPYQFVGKTSDTYFKDTTVKKGQSYYYNIGIIHGIEPEVKSSHTAQISNVGQRIPHPPLVMGIKGYIKRVGINLVPSLKNEQEYFNIIKYTLYRQKSPNDWEHIKTIDLKNRTETNPVLTVFDEKDLKDGTNYTYALSSTDDSNIESPRSDPVSVSTVQTPVLTLEKDNLLRKITLSWKFIESASGYNVYRKIDNTSWEKITDIKEILTTNFADVQNMSDGQQYFYHITAYDDKKESGPSNEVNGKTKDLPSFPENLQSQGVFAKSVKITWTALEDPDLGGYNIYRGIDCNNLQKIASIKNYRSNTYLDKGDVLTPFEDGKIYFYAAACFNLFDTEGKLSKCIKAETKPRPASVKVLTASAASDHIVISWKENFETDIAVNHLYRKDDQASWSNLQALSPVQLWSEIQQLKPGQTDYKDFDLKAGGSYSYRIISEDKDGLESDPAETQPVASPIANKEQY
ncbi:MAG: hypothetical protein KKC46_15455 [Proteobacteria bacterium]|nr:hypothetical protein [Pseudomonadota bacterium]